jgi:GTP-binding protein HflX
VWNKIDLLGGTEREDIVSAASLDDMVVPVSAETGEGVDVLLVRIGEQLTGGAHVHEFLLPASAGRRIAWLHAHGEVLDESDAGAGPDGPLRRLAVRLTPKERGQFETL